MGKNIVMRINCDECGKRYAIADNELDDYNIYWIGNGHRMPRPKLLCPKCTEFWAIKADKRVG